MFLLVVLIYIFGFTFGSVIPKNVLVNPDGRIVGGESTTIEEFPHQVSMRYRGSHKCGGSIISERIILSAAHCVDGQSPEDIQIAVGSSSKSKGSKVYAVKNIIKHEHYNSQTTENDIAILILRDSLEFGDSIQPIELPSYGEQVEDGSVVFVSGWGILSEGEFEGPDNLQFVDVKIINQEKCAAMYNSVGRKITEKMLCAGTDNGGRDTCQQDSGGPLILSNKLIGVVSWGLGCARAKYPGVYARVSAYRKWIDQESLRGLQE